MPHSCLGSVTTALRNEVGDAPPSQVQVCRPVFASNARRGSRPRHFEAMRPAYRSGGSMMWSSTLTRIMSSSFTFPPNPRDPVRREHGTRGAGMEIAPPRSVKKPLDPAELETAIDEVHRAGMPGVFAEVR